MSILDWYRHAMRTAGVREHPIVESFKKEAKQLQRHCPEYGLMQAQDIVASRHGFMHWHHAMQVADNYKKVFDESTKSQPRWRTSYFPLRTRTKEELATHGARWLGVNEFGPWHVGQTEDAQRVHTLVVGPYIGQRYFRGWLQDHLRANQPFVAWLNMQTWTEATLDIKKELPQPLVLRLGSSTGWTDCTIAATPVDICWVSISEMHAWVNVLLPDLAHNGVEAALLRELLAWVWSQDTSQEKPGHVLAPYLAPASLPNFPGWTDNPHSTLLLAGALVPLLRNTRIFNQAQASSPKRLTINALLNHTPGVIILDDGRPEDAVARSCLQAWMQTHLGHRLGVASPPLLPRPPRPPHTYWYIANIEVPLLAHMAAQCRALCIAMTYFYEVEPKTPLQDIVRANCNTTLAGLPNSTLHALYGQNNDQHEKEPLRIDGLLT